MDISKLPIQIVDPASIANQNAKEHEEILMRLINSNVEFNNIFPDFHKISNVDTNVGVYLLYIFNHPGKGDWEIVYDVDVKRNYMPGKNFHVGVNNLKYCEYAKLIEFKSVKAYRSNYGQWVTKGYFITNLGIAVLKQNELI